MSSSDQDFLFNIVAFFTEIWKCWSVWTLAHTTCLLFLLHEIQGENHYKSVFACLKRKSFEHFLSSLSVGSLWKIVTQVEVLIMVCSLPEQVRYFSVVCYLNCNALAYIGVCLESLIRSVQCKNVLLTLNILNASNETVLFIHCHLPYIHVCISNMQG